MHARRRRRSADEAERREAHPYERVRRNWASGSVPARYRVDLTSRPAVSFPCCCPRTSTSGSTFAPGAGRQPRGYAGVNTASAEADGFTRPLEVGQRRLTPTGERAEIAMPL